MYFIVCYICVLPCVSYCRTSCPFEDKQKVLNSFFLISWLNTFTKKKAHLYFRYSLVNYQRTKSSCCFSHMISYNLHVTCLKTTSQCVYMKLWTKMTGGTEVIVMKQNCTINRIITNSAVLLIYQPLLAHCFCITTHLLSGFVLPARGSCFQWKGHW